MHEDQEDDVWDSLVKFGVVLGSIWLGSEFLKSISQQKYCWRCGTLNNVNNTRCKKCGANI